MPEVLILDELRRLILKKHEIKRISPSDCRAIAFDIQKELHKNISETTLKRFFGFAASKHPFSTFTINTLKEYAEFYVQFPNDQPALKIYTEDIDEIKQTALNITQFTLRNIRNRCSVPFELTIPRKFAKYDFEYLYDSPHSFTAFIAQPGYGKSVLMYHLVQELFLSEQAKYGKDVILFINADFIFDTLKNDLVLEEELKLKLGLSPKTDFISYFKSQYDRTGSKLIIFLDGFSELVLTKHFKPRIFDSILNLVSGIEENQHIKIVIGLRSTTWSRFFERMREAHFLRKKWFAGSYFNANYNANVPPLSEKELDSILQRINPTDQLKVNDQLKAQLKFPFHIQWYYKLREEYPNFNSFTNLVFFEIIFKFIQEKIFNSTYATEKIIFCKKIVQLTENGKSGHTVLKTELIKDLAKFNNAYMQLLADGILMEEKKYQDGHFVEHVRFIQPHVFEYFLFEELVDLFDQQVTQTFLTYVQTEYFGNNVRFQLLQWAVRHIVSQKNLQSISAILHLKLSNYEKNYLIHFIAENLNYKIKNDPQVRNFIKEQNLHQLLIEQFVHFDFIDSCYREAITSLLAIIDTAENALVYHSIMGIFDSFSLDRDCIITRLHTMEIYPEASEKWLINPHEALKLVYVKTKGLTQPDNDVLRKIEAFKNYPPCLVKDENELPGTQQIISYVLMLLVNLFYGSPKEAIAIVNSILLLHPKLLKTRNSFSIYVLNIAAMAYGRTEEVEIANRLERILKALHEGFNNNQFTLYTQTSYFAFRAEQCSRRKEYALALHYAEDCLQIFERNNLTIYQILMYNLIISIYTKLGNTEKANAYLDQRISLLDEKKINPMLFNYTIPN